MKRNTGLRIILILCFFVLGMVCVFLGWFQEGKMSGLIIMLVGVVLLLTALFVYNAAFSDPKRKMPKKK
ncbi:MAG: hypothetical protein PUK59_05665 [Actinomycetaceae bacterium]|nr:hypothetical protein [Actinomycetaceae bacterium]MDY5854712.1 hypothetical protein [Arcanobacterium sp.]